MLVNSLHLCGCEFVDKGYQRKPRKLVPHKQWLFHINSILYLFVHLFQSTRMGISGLFIHFIDYYHSGVYECVAMSTITQSSISTNVIVQGIMQASISTFFSLLLFFSITFKLTYQNFYYYYKEHPMVWLLANHDKV